MARLGDTYGSGNFIKAGDDGTIDVPGRPYELVGTISKVETTTFKGDDEERKQRVISFKEHGELRLGLNVTNWKAIAKFTGKQDDDEWVGEVVELFAVPEERSQSGHAIRVRKPRARQPAPAAFKPLGNDGANRLSARLKGESRSEANLRAHLAAKFPQHSFDGDIPTWPLECGLSIAEWFKKPEPAFGVAAPDEEIPF